MRGLSEKDTRNKRDKDMGQGLKGRYYNNREKESEDMKRIRKERKVGGCAKGREKNERDMGVRNEEIETIERKRVKIRRKKVKVCEKQREKREKRSAKVKNNTLSRSGRTWHPSTFVNRLRISGKMKQESKDK